MNQLIQKILDTGKIEALKSSDALQKASAELGFSADEAAAAIDDFDSSPLDEDELLEVAGGAIARPTHRTPSNPADSLF